MPRDLPLSNGSFLVNFDSHHHLRDIHFPHVGKENHSYGRESRFGVWVDGEFRWLSAPGWDLDLRYADDSLAADVTASHSDLGVSLRFEEAIDFYDDSFIRRVTVLNENADPREVRLFFHHDLAIGGNAVGDTAFYHPEEEAVIAYKNVHYILVGGRTQDGSGPDDWTIGRADGHLRTGSWQDAEDGELRRIPVAFGSVDFVVGFHLGTMPAGDTSTVYCWMTVGDGLDSVLGYHQHIIRRGPDHFLERTTNYWRAWVNKESAATDRLARLPEPVRRMYKRSLLITRAQTDNQGGIIAAADSDISRPYHTHEEWEMPADDPFRGYEDYSYCWSRDGSLVAMAMDRAGYGRTAGRFLDFCANVMVWDRERDWAYMRQKYMPNRSLASNVIPWVDAQGRPRLPVQEDETALVLVAFCNHYMCTREFEFMARWYRPLVKGMANFLLEYREPLTGLPLPSQDLWEERDGVHAFTVATVWAGLQSAACMTDVFGETGVSKHYRAEADRIKEAVERHMYDEGEARFVRTVHVDEQGSVSRDLTVDVSLIALAYFGMFEPTDPRIVRTVDAVRSRLAVGGAHGGIARFEGDVYQLTPSGKERGIPGNPWFLCSLWEAQYSIMAAQTAGDLSGPLETLEWVAAHALPSGVLSEQLDSDTGEPVSATPLTWSHGTFVLTVLEYLDALDRIEDA